MMMLHAHSAAVPENMVYEPPRCLVWVATASRGADLVFLTSRRRRETIDGRLKLWAMSRSGSLCSPLDRLAPLAQPVRGVAGCYERSDGRKCGSRHYHHRGAYLRLG
jgi:hypothetical protein